MTDPVSVELNEDEIKGMTDSEKLSVLIRIAFANHTRLNTQSAIIFGNGNPEKGLCYQVSMLNTKVKWLLRILSPIGAALLALVVKAFIK